jgi:ADP-heptose:LPS heptosyltransferase
MQLPEITAAAGRVAKIPHAWLNKRPFIPPQKALILHPQSPSEAILATPLLTLLHQAFPNARIDWAISRWARPIITGNPYLTDLPVVSEGPLDQADQAVANQLVSILKQGAYDTCFIPSTSTKLAWAARQAGIPQRVGLWANGRGWWHTIAARPLAGERHQTARYLALAEAVGVNTGFSLPPMRFYPSDADRTAVTARLIDELDWLGDRPLMLLHPGVDQEGQEKCWPVERFVLLGNQILREYGAQLLLVGDETTLPAAREVAGLISGNAANWAGRVTLGHIGALAEVADLYVGNDTAATHVATAMGCATVAIFGPSDPAVSAPYGERDARLEIVKPVEGERPFTWGDSVTVREVSQAVRKLLGKKG